jgi:Na+(H+)/acetate symporter ActP
MKEALKKVFDKSVLAVLAVLIVFVLVFEYIVFPGLTAADTYVNILSVIVGLVSIMFVYHFIQWRDLSDFILGKDRTPSVEIESTYQPKEVAVKKKKVYKKKKTTKKKVVDEEPTKPKTTTKKK